MSSGNEKVNIFLKKFLTQQDITTNFLDYLHNLILEGHSKLISKSGIYSYPVTGRSDVVDAISFLTPGETNPTDGNGPQLEGDDGHGRILKLLDSRRVDVPVPNTLGVKYYCGIRFNYYPNQTEINVRTGKIKWSLFQEAIGERAEPNVVSYYSAQLTMKVDSVCGDVDQVGRTVRVWLKEPVSQSTGDVFEDVVISKQSISFLHDGGANFLDVPNELKGYFQNGQTLTVDKTASSPQVTTIASIGADDSGGTGFVRINVAHDLSGYTVANGGYVLSGNNIVNLVGSLGQAALSSTDATDYESFLYGISVTTNDLRNDEYYAYLLNYTGTGIGSNPGMFDSSDQVEVPQDLGGIVTQLDQFKEYQLQRNGMILRGGGQFSFNAGVLEWKDQFQIVNPFRGVYEIPANTIAAIADDDVIYTKIYQEKRVIISGTASGEIWLEDTTDLNDNDKVIIGDSDTDKVEGYIFGVPGTEKVIIDDGGGTPLDLSAFTTGKGAWLQRKNNTLVKGVINEGDLRPDAGYDMNESILIVAVAHSGVLIFKNGVLRLEDGDVGQISNLPSNFNWINTDTELKDSVVSSGDGNVGILAPRTYTLSSKLTYNKNFSWAGLTEQTVIEGNLATPLIEVVPDPSTSGAYQSIEFKNLTLKNLGAGNVLQIDNTGATKGMEIILDSCVLLASSGLSINVIHGEAGQWIKLKFLNSKKELSQGSMVIESKNNSDDYVISHVLMSPTDSITFGEAATDPTSKLQILNSKVDKVIALGSGNSKSIEITDTYSWNDNKKLDIEGETNATFKISQVIVEHFEYTNYQKARNSLIMKTGKPASFAGGTLTWTTAFEFHDAFFGLAMIPINNLVGIINGDILYTKIDKPQFSLGDGNASGEIDVPEASKFIDNDQVLIGDQDTVLISGYIFGAPVGDKLTIDDGGGTPIDLSSITLAKGGWVRKTNLTMLKSQPNTGDLKPDVLGDLDEEVYIIAKNDDGTLLYSNGETSGGKVYEETKVLDSAKSAGDLLTLPVNSRDGGANKYYNVGSGDLTMFVNGVKQEMSSYILVTSFDPDAYTGGTGVIDLPDAVNLALVRVYDKFKDVDDNEFVILGDIDNTPGQKQVRINTGETVNVGAGSRIIRQDFKETGSLLSNQVECRRPFPVNASITYRVIPIDSLASGGGVGGSGTLQDAYDTGSSITIVSGTPVVISGPGGQKLLRILGDLEVTGMIDPKGMTFSRNVSKPWSDAQDGIWCDDNGNFKYYNKDTEKNEPLSGNTEGNYNNPAPSTMIKGSAVTKSGVGNIQYADYNTDELSRAIGILMGEIDQSESENVKQFGYVPPGIITSANFTEASLPADRARIWLHASGKLTVTGPTQGSGKFEVIMGIWNDLGLNLQVQVLGQA